MKQLSAVALNLALQRSDISRQTNMQTNHMPCLPHLDYNHPARSHTRTVNDLLFARRLHGNAELCSCHQEFCFVQSFIYATNDSVLWETLYWSYSIYFQSFVARHIFLDIVYMFRYICVFTSCLSCHSNVSLATGLSASVKVISIAQLTSA